MLIILFHVCADAGNHYKEGRQLMDRIKSKSNIVRQIEINEIHDVQQNSIHFCFYNFSASKVSKNSILDIFQQPV